MKRFIIPVLLGLLICASIITPIVIVEEHKRDLEALRVTYDWTEEYVEEIVGCKGYEYYVYTSQNVRGRISLEEAEDVKIITFYLGEEIVTYLVYHKGNDIDWEVMPYDK